MIIDKQMQAIKHADWSECRDDWIAFIRQAPDATVYDVSLMSSEITRDMIRRRLQETAQHAGRALEWLQQAEAGKEVLSFRVKPKSRWGTLAAAAGDFRHSTLAKAVIRLFNVAFAILDLGQLFAIATGIVAGGALTDLDGFIGRVTVMCVFVAITFVLFLFGGGVDQFSIYLWGFGFIYVVVAALMLVGVSVHVVLRDDISFLVEVGYIMIIAFLALIGLAMCIYSKLSSKWMSGVFVLVLLAQGVLVLYTLYFRTAGPAGTQLLGMLLLMLMPGVLALIAVLSDQLRAKYMPA